MCDENLDFLQWLNDDVRNESIQEYSPVGGVHCYGVLNEVQGDGISQGNYLRKKKLQEKKIFYLWHNFPSNLLIFLSFYSDILISYL